MAQPQGLNIPAIAVTGVVTVLLTAVIVEGVRAYYSYEVPMEEARKWETVHLTTPEKLRIEQEKHILDDTAVPIDQAMAQVAARGGKMPSTRPNS